MFPHTRGRKNMGGPAHAMGCPYDDSPTCIRFSAADDLRQFRLAIYVLHSCFLVTARFYSIQKSRLPRRSLPSSWRTFMDSWRRRRPSTPTGDSSHAGPAGHHDIKATETVLGKQFHWIASREDVRLSVSTCIHCLATTGENVFSVHSDPPSTAQSRTTSSGSIKSK